MRLNTCWWPEDIAEVNWLVWVKGSVFRFETASKYEG